MKDVLVFLSPTAGDRLSPGAHYVLGLAHAHDAHLSALIAEIKANLLNLSPEPDFMQAMSQGSSRHHQPRCLQAEFVRSAAKLAQRLRIGGGFLILLTLIGDWDVESECSGCHLLSLVIVTN